MSQIYFGMKLHVSGSSSALHQEFIHCTLGRTRMELFPAVPPPIIRSLFTVHSALVYVIQVCRQLSSRTRVELQCRVCSE